jgi:hypothetical protein
LGHGEFGGRDPGGKFVRWSGVREKRGNLFEFALDFSFLPMGAGRGRQK